MPTRSVRYIIRILEREGQIIPGNLSRSTLQRHMQKSSFSKRQMQVYTKKGTASRRFQKPHRCMLFQGDIKHGSYLPIGENGEKKLVYVFAFIDDATRFIVSAKFYDNQRVEIIEDSLRQNKRAGCGQVYDQLMDKDREQRYQEKVHKRDLYSRD